MEEKGWNRGGDKRLSPNQDDVPRRADRRDEDRDRADERSVPERRARLADQDQPDAAEGDERGTDRRARYPFVKQQRRQPERDQRRDIGERDRLRERDAPQPPEGQHRDRRRNSAARSEEHTSELQSLMRISYAVFCLKKKKKKR